jgi:DNA-directed RNA polymerase specialized sigma24 family protein
MTSLIKASEEGETIQYLVVGDPRGEKLLRKYYGASLYGMIARMRSCPIQSNEILQSTFSKIQTDIGRFSGKLSFFTWMMQVARRLSIDYGKLP